MFASFPQLTFLGKHAKKKIIKRTSLTSKPYWSQTPISEVLELKKKKENISSNLSEKPQFPF